jgi:predicted GNAT family N-acyltransferase
MNVQIRQPNSKDFPAILRLRYEALSKPYGFELRTKPSAADLAPSAIHRAAYIGDKLVGTVRLDLLEGSIYEVRRMAVDQSCRGMGIGTLLLREAEIEASAKGAKWVKLNSRPKATSFYQYNGYIPTGESVEINGDSHTVMHKQLKKA